MLKTNLEYFELTLQNPEPIFDLNYAHFEEDKNLEKHIQKINTIKEYLITIQKLEQHNDSADKYYQEILKLLKVGTNYSEFMCFLNACDITTNSINILSINDIKELIQKFFMYRNFNNTFDFSLTPKQWIQAIIDKGSSRKNGKLGEAKISNMLEKYNFIKATTLNKMYESNQAFLQFDKDNININNINKFFNININLHNQNKLLDIIIKYNNTIIFLEAKHLKEKSGSQDKQIVELINILKHKNISNSKYNIKFIAFLDGIYLNNLNDQKITIAEINKNLTNNLTNYWLNTTSLKEFLKNLIK